MFDIVICLVLLMCTLTICKDATQINKTNFGICFIANINAFFWTVILVPKKISILHFFLRNGPYLELEL